MAKIKAVDDALRRWAAAVAGEGDGSGYPTKSVLHPTWSPPTSGQTPTMKTVRRGGDVELVHAAIGQLSLRERNTVVVHYCKRMPLDEQGTELGCQPKTVLERISTIHRRLVSVLERPAQTDVDGAGG
jgi:DNA-directed RNA polymerase specialized sigma24 family protein